MPRLKVYNPFTAQYEYTGYGTTGTTGPTGATGTQTGPTGYTGPTGLQQLPTAQALAHTPDSFAAVGTTSTLIAASNAARVQIWISPGLSPVFIALGAPAVLNQGIELVSGQPIWTTQVFTGAIYGITASGTVNIPWAEV